MSLGGIKSMMRRKDYDPVLQCEKYGIKRPYKTRPDFNKLPPEVQEEMEDLELHLIDTPELWTPDYIDSLSPEEVEAKFLAMNNLILYAAWKWGRNR